MRISVILTCFNAHATLEAALRSVLAQTRPVDEVIIVDDGSTDDSVKIARNCMPSATIITQPNGGVSAARNTGLAHITGTMVALLDDDDLWHPTKLERQVAIFEQRPELDLVATSWSRITPEPKTTDQLRWLSYRDLTLMNQFQTSTVLMRTALARKVGTFNSQLDSVEDWAYWIECSKFGTLAILTSDLVMYRDSPDGVSKDLGRFWRALLHMLAETKALDLLETQDRQVIEAWHAQRMLVAAALARDPQLLTTIIRSLPRKSPRAHTDAFRTLTAPFLQERLMRRRSA